MFKIIRTEIIDSFKIKSLKSLVIGLLLIFVLGPIISYIHPMTLPMIFTFIIIMNSFYNKSINNNEIFSLSLPIKREDIVYSKYILAVIIMLLSLVLGFILFDVNFLDLARTLTSQDVITAIFSTLIMLSIVIPINFKFNYRMARVISSVIFMSTWYGTFKFINIISNQLISVGCGLNDNINSQYYLDIVNGYTLGSIRLIGITTLAIVIFIVSMYISLIIYKNKDLS